MGIPVKKGDQVILAMAGIQANTFRLSMRIERPNGKLTSPSLDHPSSADRTTALEVTKTLPEGILHSASLERLTGNDIPLPGFHHAEASLFRGGERLGVFMRGYFHNGHVPSFPGPLEGSLDGPGRPRVVSLAAEALGGDGLTIFAVPANTLWHVKAIVATYVASATMGNRAPLLLLRDGGATQFFRGETGVVPTAGLTRIMVFSPDTEVDVALTHEGGTSHGKIPGNVRMSETFDILIDDTADIDNNDTVAFDVLVDEWLMTGA